MSLSSRPARLLAGLSAAALCSLAVVAPAHAATSLNVAAQSSFPKGGVQPASFTITFPEGLKAGDWAPTSIVSNFRSAGAETQGVAVEAVSGTSVGVQVDGVSPSTSIPAGSYPASAPLIGTLPDPPAAYGALLQFPDAGAATATVTSLHLNLRALSSPNSGVIIYPSTTESDFNPETFDVSCTLDAGQALTATIPVAPRTGPLDTTAPTAPGPITVTARSQRSFTVAWGASSDDVAVDRYRVIVSEANGNRVPSQQTSALSATFRSLKPGTSYTVQVAAIDRGPNVSPTTTATVSTVPLPTDKAFVLRLSGAAALQGRVRGSIPLNGTLEGTVYAGSGEIGAGLALTPSTASFRLAGVLQATAKATFTSVDPTSGSLASGVFQTRSTTAVKFSDARIFGTIPLATSAACGLADPAVITLTSAAGFDPAVGGPLTGTAKLGRLTNCGAFGQLVGPDLGTATVNLTTTPAT